MKHAARLLLLSLLVCGTARAQSVPSDEDIVRRAYPDALLADFYEDADPADHAPLIYAFQRADLDGTGKADYLVAAYSNGGHGTVRVLRVVSGAPVVAAESTLRDLGGTSCFVELRRLDTSATPEIVVSYERMRGKAVWIYQWANGGLRLFGPMRTDSFGQQHTVLADPVFVDVDGDGIEEIIVPAERNTSSLTSKTYQLRDGTFTPVESTLFFATYRRTEGDPDEFEDNIACTPGKYVVNIVNGDRTGAQKVTSATVQVNGASVFTAADFKKQARTLSAPVTLTDHAIVTVSVAGAPDSLFTLSIKPSK